MEVVDSVVAFFSDFEKLLITVVTSVESVVSSVEESGLVSGVIDDCFGRTVEGVSNEIVDDNVVLIVGLVE